jgi:hypothetical protein
VFNNNDLEEYHNLPLETKVFCSEPLNIISEYRCFVRYGKLLGCQRYNGGNQELDINLIENAITDYVDSPNAYVLDFGITDKGETILIEVNDGFSLGCYGLSPKKYALFLITRWCELLKIEDPFLHLN